MNTPAFLILTALPVAPLHLNFVMSPRMTDYRNGKKSVSIAQHEKVAVAYRHATGTAMRVPHLPLN